MNRPRGERNAAFFKRAQEPPNLMIEAYISQAHRSGKLLLSQRLGQGVHKSSQIPFTKTDSKWWESELLSLVDLSRNPHLEEIDGLWEREEEVVELKVSFCPLTKVPSLALLNLQKLSLHDCQLASFPSTPFPALVSLDVSQNLLPSLDLSCAPNLRVLNAHHNQITHFKYSSSALIEVDLAYNQLREVDVSSSGSLAKLNVAFNVHLNSLPSLEQSILNSLDVSNTGLSHLHPLPSSLTSFKGAMNKLTDVEFLRNCLLIKEVDLRQNRLTTLDTCVFSFKHLVCLDIRSNRLSSLPTWLGWMNLKALEVQGNMLRAIRHELVGDSRKLLEYLKNRHAGDLPQVIQGSVSLKELRPGLPLGSKFEGNNAQNVPSNRPNTVEVLRKPTKMSSSLRKETKARVKTYAAPKTKPRYSISTLHLLPDDVLMSIPISVIQQGQQQVVDYLMSHQ